MPQVICPTLAFKNVWKYLLAVHSWCFHDLSLNLMIISGLGKGQLVFFYPPFSSFLVLDLSNVRVSHMTFELSGLLCMILNMYPCA